MKFDPTKHRILMGHLEEVERVMLESGCTHDEAAGVVADLSFQIDKMMSEIEREITESDEIAIMRQLDHPGAYARDPDTVGESTRRFESVDDLDVDEDTESDPPVDHEVKRKWLVPLIVLAVCLSITLGIIFWLISARNQVISAEETVDSSFAQIETVLQRRFDLIPNLVSTVKGFAEQEKEIFLEIARLRSQWGAASSREEKVDTANALEGKISQVIHLKETYPALRSNEQFSQLQFQLEATENRISVERSRYNNAVRNYNSLARRFPGSLFGFETRDSYFKAEEAASEAPKVSF